MARVKGASSSQHPAADIALPIGVASRGDHAAVGLKPHRVCHAFSDLGDVRPASDIALTVEVPSRGDDGAVGLKRHRELAASGDLDDVGPAADIALSIFVLSHGDHSTVGFKPHCVMTACSDLDDARPASDTALPAQFPPTATTVPSDLSPTVCHELAPAATWMMSVQPLTLH